MAERKLRVHFKGPSGDLNPKTVAVEVYTREGAIPCDESVMSLVSPGAAKQAAFLQRDQEIKAARKGDASGSLLMAS